MAARDSGAPPELDRIIAASGRRNGAVERLAKSSCSAAARPGPEVTCTGCSRSSSWRAGISAEETVRLEHQRQGAMKREPPQRHHQHAPHLLGLDWAEFVEGLSLVDRVATQCSKHELRHARRYGRHREVARRSGGRGGSRCTAIRRRPRAESSPHQRAGRSGAWTRAATRTDRAPRRGRDLVLRRRPSSRRSSAACRGPSAARAFSRMATWVISARVASEVMRRSSRGPLAAAASGVPDLSRWPCVLADPASDVRAAITNRRRTTVSPCRRRGGSRSRVPSRSCGTLVVVLMLLADEAVIEGQVSLWRSSNLANAEGDVRFALRSDRVDAPSEHAPDDEAAGRGGLLPSIVLNARHGEARAGGPLPALRPRTPLERSPGVWMGWNERGKLDELRLLNGLCRHLRPGHGATLIAALSGVR